MEKFARLDEELVARGLAATRSRARDAIARGTVFIDGVPATKAGQKVAPASHITSDDPASAYVSRAALKLVAGLDASGIDPAGQHALDIGASTGGFTQVLLERGAASVIALDVGHGQLHQSLRRDRRVTVIEGVNARDLSAEHLGDRLPTLVVSDVSFISLTLALPPALALAPSGSRCILLVKPQFEVGRQAIGKNGVVAPDRAKDCADDLKDWLDGLPHWTADGLVPTPFTGADGNREFLLWGHKS